MMTRETITIGRQRFRVGPWQANSGVAHLSVASAGFHPEPADLLGVLEHLQDQGYESVLTSAIEEVDSSAFSAAGFHELDRLRVLRHDLSGMDRLPQPPERSRLRRGRRVDRATALAIDRRAFPAFWQLDGDGLSEAESATPYSRFRVSFVEGRIAGYAVTGRGGRTGFLQRLATDPDLQRRGVASGLVCDGLRWCARHRSDAVFVNTQTSNIAALLLYERLGFHTTSSDLVVMMWVRP